MKIAIDLTSLADNFSGIERYAACISLEMIQHQEVDYVLIFKTQIHPLFQKYQNADNVRCVVLPRCNKLMFNQIRLPMAIHRIQADAYLFLAFPVPILSFKKNMISTIHDICCWDCPETMNGLSKWYFRISHRVAVIKCKTIITISDFSKKRIQEELHCSDQQLLRIYCGVDERFFIPLDKKQIKNVKEKYQLPEKYILSLSTLEPRKKLDLLLDAYNKVVMEYGVEMPLILAGRKGWKIDSLLDRYDANTRKQIRMTGFIDEADIVPLYQGAHIFVFPSMYEGFGIPPLEAMAAGVPVLASDAASLPEVLGDTAAFFCNGNVESLTNELINMIELEESDRQDLCMTGRERAAKYSWCEQARLLLDKIKERCNGLYVK